MFPHKHCLPHISSPPLLAATPEHLNHRPSKSTAEPPRNDFLPRAGQPVSFGPRRFPQSRPVRHHRLPESLDRTPRPMDQVMSARVLSPLEVSCCHRRSDISNKRVKVHGNARPWRENIREYQGGRLTTCWLDMLGQGDSLQGMRKEDRIDGDVTFSQTLYL